MNVCSDVELLAVAFLDRVRVRGIGHAVGVRRERAGVFPQRAGGDERRAGESGGPDESGCSEHTRLGLRAGLEEAPGLGEVQATHGEDRGRTLVVGLARGRCLGREPGPAAVGAQRLESELPPAGQDPGDRVAVEEAVERIVVVPERDEPDAPDLGRGEQASAQRCRERHVRMAKAGDGCGLGRLGDEPERRAGTDVGDVHGSNHEVNVRGDGGGVRIGSLSIDS